MWTQGEKEEGFTLIEVIIVVTLIGILTATLIPQFKLMTERTRIKVDIDSLKVLQKQIDIYEMDHDRMPGVTLAEMVSTLAREDYLNEKYIDMTNYKIHLETEGAEVIYDPSVKQVKLKLLEEQYNIFVDNQDKVNWLVTS